MPKVKHTPPPYPEDWGRWSKRQQDEWWNANRGPVAILDLKSGKWFHIHCYTPPLGSSYDPWFGGYRSLGNWALVREGKVRLVYHENDWHDWTTRKCQCGHLIRYEN